MPNNLLNVNPNDDNRNHTKWNTLKYKTLSQLQPEPITSTRHDATVEKCKTLFQSKEKLAHAPSTQPDLTLAVTIHTHTAHNTRTDAHGGSFEPTASQHGHLRFHSLSVHAGHDEQRLRAHRQPRDGPEQRAVPPHLERGEGLG